MNEPARPQPVCLRGDVAQRASRGHSVHGTAHASTKKGYSFTVGLRVYNIADPEKPREIGFMPVDGFGPHRMWYVGGRYLHASAHIRSYTDYVLLTIYVSDPTKPHEVGSYWLPGMWVAAGEKPSWPGGQRFSAHHAQLSSHSLTRPMPSLLSSRHACHP